MALAGAWQLVQLASKILLIFVENETLKPQVIVPPPPVPPLFPDGLLLLQLIILTVRYNANEAKIYFFMFYFLYPDERKLPLGGCLYIKKCISFFSVMPRLLKFRLRVFCFLALKIFFE